MQGTLLSHPCQGGLRILCHERHEAMRDQRAEIHMLLLLICLLLLLLLLRSLLLLMEQGVQCSLL